MGWFPPTPFRLQRKVLNRLALELSFKNRSKLITCSGKGGIYLDEDGVQVVAIASIGDSKEIEKFLMKRPEAFNVQK